MSQKHLDELERRKLQEELFQLEDMKDDAEERYQHLFENALVGLYRARLADGKFIAANGEAARLLGYADLGDVAQHSNVMEAIFGGAKHSILEDLRNKGRIESLTTKISKADGTLVYLELTAKAYPDAGYVEGVIKDVTEQSNAEEKLRESERHHRQIFECTTDAMLIFNTNGNIVEANPAACAMYGYEYVELISLSGGDIVHPDYYHLFENFKQQLKVKGIFHSESVDVRKDGTPFDIEVRGAGVEFQGKRHLLAVIREITERKRAEEALRESEEKLEGILGSITDHMSMIDEEFNIVWTNEVARRLFGADVVGRKCYSAYHGRDRVCDSCAVKACFNDGRVHEHETEAIGADGNTMTLWCTASVAARYEDGRPRMVVETSRDITERKRAEEALRENMRKLERFNRMAVGREQRMIELKEEVNDLLRTLGRERKYRCSARGNVSAIARGPVADGAPDGSDEGVTGR